MLKGSDNSAADRETVFTAPRCFWLIGATDGHAKHFSLVLGPGGSYRLTPLYDALTAQPSLDARHVQRKPMTLSMSVGTNRHCRIDEIQRRHFAQTATAAGLSKSTIARALEEVADRARKALETVEGGLPKDCPASLHASVSMGVRERLDRRTASP